MSHQDILHNLWAGKRSKYTKKEEQIGQNNMTTATTTKKAAKRLVVKAKAKAKEKTKMANKVEQNRRPKKKKQGAKTDERGLRRQTMKSKKESYQRETTTLSRRQTTRCKTMDWKRLKKSSCHLLGHVAQYKASGSSGEHQGWRSILA